MKLLIDLGNTRLKWATWSGARLQAGGVFAHAGQSLVTELRREWVELVRVDAVLVASVLAQAREQELDDFVGERFSLRAEFVRSPAAALGLRNAYAEPARLGVDRFLALATLHAQQPCAQVLASVGTALTIDALDVDGVHHGGLILPAPQLMREALLAGTARVGNAQGRYRELPDNTADAVVSGSLYAALGAIERFRANMARRLGTEPVLHLTGGGANELAALAALLPDAARAHDLVLRGLALWAERGLDR
jgi:type III pantothenate kinase